MLQKPCLYQLASRINPQKNSNNKISDDFTEPEDERASQTELNDPT